MFDISFVFYVRLQWAIVITLEMCRNLVAGAKYRKDVHRKCTRVEIPTTLTWLYLRFGESAGRWGR